MMDAMDDLVTWLRGQLDEDERVARAVEDRSAPWDGQWKNDSDHALRTHNGWVLAHNGGKPYAPGLLDHIARHDPARVLREVEAKRLRLARHRPEERAVVVQRGRTERRLCCVQCSRPDELLDPDEAAEWPCPDIRDDMAVYADRPGYREEWRP